MKDYLRLGLTLLIICAIAAGVLALLNSVTGPVIAKNAQEASYGQFYEVLGDSVDIQEVPEEQKNSIQSTYPEITSILQATEGDQIVSYIFTVKSNGYGGEMENALLIDPEGNIQGFRNLSNAETPGFGNVISEESYYSRFEGKSIAENDQLVLGSGGGPNEIEAISGSTVTSNAVLDGLNKVVAAYTENFANN